MKKTKKRVRLLIICYVLALIVWLGYSGISLAVCSGARSGRNLVEQYLPTAFANDINNIEHIDSVDNAEWLLTMDSDPQIIWHLGGVNVQQLIFNAKAVNAPGGEIVVYYTTREGEDFSENKKIWAQQDRDGRWVFEFGLKRIHNLRIDPGPMGGVIWRVQQITLNAEKPWYSYFVPNTQGIALLLLLPCLVWGFVTEVWAFLQPQLAKRRFERRWEEKTTHN